MYAVLISDAYYKVIAIVSSILIGAVSEFYK